MKTKFVEINGFDAANDFVVLGRVELSEKGKILFRGFEDEDPLLETLKRGYFKPIPNPGDRVTPESGSEYLELLPTLPEFNGSYLRCTQVKVEEVVEA